MSEKLMVILPRLVRQENTRDNSVYNKQQASLVKELVQTLDNVAKLAQRHHTLRLDILQLENQIYTMCSSLDVIDLFHQV